MPARLLVSVSDEEGRGVDGIATSAFRLSTVAVAAGGSAVEITSQRRVNGLVSGIYSISVAPSQGRSWRAGRFIVALGIHEFRGDGQAILEFQVP